MPLAPSLGLTDEEAARKLAATGPNELPSAQARSKLRILLGVLKEPMVGLLLGCSALYLVMGEPHEGVPLFFSIFLVVGISFYQEWRAERAIEALKELSSPRARVIRGGRELRIPGREVVPGDWLILREGDRVAADGKVSEAAHLRIDESLLTGESVPARKAAGAPVYSGSLVVGGRGQAVIEATGPATELGKIGRSLAEPAPETSAIARETAALVRTFGAFGIGASLLIIVAYGISRGDWAHGVLAGLSAAMSLLPEEFPLVLTIFLSMGAWRLSRVQVLARRGGAIETLGSITTLCVDKTGTLTRNRMALRELRTLGARWRDDRDPAELPEAVHALVESAALASHVDAFDPIDRAVLRLLEEKLAGTEHIHRDWELVREYPLSDELLAMSCVWKSRARPERVVASKGAPEAILDLCHLGPEVSGRAREIVSAMSGEGLRVLGVARAVFGQPGLPAHPHEFEFELAGFLGFEDPVREQAPAAIAECYRAGIRVAMITGDHPNTALSIARQAGFRNPERLLTGAELGQLSDAELAARVRDVEVFARVVPQQKLRIIHALKANREVVAMTGDGVNDAPALKWADVGIAMGERGTDVAREAADLVLLDDDFSSIVAGIRMGRRIYENLVSAMSYVIAVHLPIAALAVLPVLLGFPLVLYPAHIVFLELIVDPASTLVFEGQDPGEGIMRRKPREAGRPTLDRATLLGAALEGCVAAAACVIALLAARRFWPAEESARAVAFSALIVCNLALVVANRSAGAFRSREGGNLRAWILVLAALALLAAVDLVPALRAVFQMSSLTAEQAALVGALGVATAWICARIRGPLVFSPHLL